jgi:hypothetical protein
LRTRFVWYDLWCSTTQDFAKELKTHKHISLMSSSWFLCAPYTLGWHRVIWQICTHGHSREGKLSITPSPLNFWENQTWNKQVYQILITKIKLFSNLLSPILNNVGESVKNSLKRLKCKFPKIGNTCTKWLQISLLTTCNTMPTEFPLRWQIFFTWKCE